MKLELIIEGVPIVLSNSTVLTIQNQESFLWRTQRGERSFPFRLEWTKDLRSIYGRIEDISFVKLTDYKKNAVLLADGYLITEGLLSVTDATDMYIQLEMNVAPGNIPLEIWNKKLRTCNWGTETIPVGSLTSVELSEHYKKYDGNVRISHTTTAGAIDYTKRSFQFHLWYNPNGVLGSVCYVDIKGTPINLGGGSSRIDFEIVDIMAALSLLNNAISAMQLEDNYPPISFTYADGVLVYYNDEIDSNYSLKIKITDFYNITLDFATHSYESVGNYYNAYAYGDISNRKFALPQLYNADFYSGGDDTYINKRTTSGGIELNTEDSPLGNVLMPCLTLRFILEKIMQEIGYTLTGDLADDIFLKKAVVVTNIAVGRSVLGTDYFDIFAKTFGYATLAPDFSIKEFLDYIFDQLGFVPDYDATRKILHTTYVGSVINSNNVAQVDKLAKERKVRISEAKQVRIKWNDVDEKLTQYQPYPLEEIADAEPIDLYFPPVRFEDGLHQTDGAGVTFIKNQSDNKPICRLCFVDDAGNVSNQYGFWNLNLYGTDNLYEQVFAPQLKYLNSAEFEYKTKMKVSEVLAQKANTKINLNGVNCFRKEIQYKIQPNIDFTEVVFTLVAS